MAFDSARLTTLLRIKGQAMAPTLLASAPPDAVETLLVRRLPQPAHDVHRGDVVALRHPEASDGALLVRRVVALPGDTLVSSDEDAEAVALQPGMCWVTRDNEEARRPGPGTGLVRSHATALLRFPWPLRPTAAPSARCPSPRWWGGCSTPGAPATTTAACRTAPPRL